MNARTCTLLASLVLSLAGAAPVFAAGADDFGRNVTLPAPTSFISIDAATAVALRTVQSSTLLRLKLELESGRWIYRAELATSRARDLYRLDIDARTGALLRSKKNKPGGSDQRTIVGIQNIASGIRVSFPDAAAIALTAAPGIASDVRLDVDNRTLTYKVTTVTQTSRTEVRIDPVSGNILRTSTEGVRDDAGDDSNHDAGDDHGGNNNNGNNNPPANPGTPPPPSNPGTPSVPAPAAPTAALSGQAATLALAIDLALANEPAGATFIEAKFRRVSFGSQVDVAAGIPGDATLREYRVSFPTRQVNSESDAAGDDGAVLAAYAQALAGRTPIAPAQAMAIASAARRADVSRLEIGVVGGTPIYEVKVLSGGREVSVKVNAVSGAILR